jgi:hypothetical protein
MSGVVEEADDVSGGSMPSSSLRVRSPDSMMLGFSGMFFSRGRFEGLLLVLMSVMLVPQLSCICITENGIRPA